MKKLYVITLRARPAPNTSEFAELGGAFVNVWVDASARDEALHRATAEVKDVGWVVEEIEGVVAVSRADYEEDDPNLEYFDQALIDRLVCVFHEWPVAAQEDDTLH